MKTKTYKIYYIFIPVLWLLAGFSQPTWSQEDPNPESPNLALSDSAATPVLQTNQPRTEPSPRATTLSDLTQTQQNLDTEVIQLSTGESAFDAFYKHSSTALIHGGIIIFPDDRTHPNWPIITNPLRVGLSNYGWETLALSLPQPTTLANPLRTLPALKIIRDKPTTNEEEPLAPASEQTTNPTTEEQSPPIEKTIKSETNKIIMQRGIAAIQYLQQKGMKRLVLIGAGTGASWATALAADLQDQANIKLLIINAEQSQDISAPKLLALIPKLTLTSLDLYSATPISITTRHKQEPRLRIETARRHKLNNYHQSRLPQITNTLSGQEWLVRYTRGLLKTHVINTEKEAINKGPVKQIPSINQKPGATQDQINDPI